MLVIVGTRIYTVFAWLLQPTSAEKRFSDDFTLISVIISSVHVVVRHHCNFCVDSYQSRGLFTCCSVSILVERYRQQLLSHIVDDYPRRYSRVGGAYSGDYLILCLSFQTISQQIDAAKITKLDMQMFHYPS